ncbi:MAG: transporter substrate-binding domain-containing protein [Rhizobium sp.]|nr:transporter substrate-binding domain-containing protein [Rhizobium sp.]
MKHIVAGIIAVFATTAVAEPLSLVTEDYPPYAYRENGKLIGSSVEQVELMMKAIGQDHTMEMMPWARALALAEKQPRHCVFTTTHNAERDPHFKWVEPLLWGRTLLVRKSGTAVNPVTLDQARDLTVGATRDDFTADLLKAKNFRKIDLATDFNLNLKKLMLGRIDMMPIAEDYYNKLRREGTEIDRVLILSEQIFSLACNKSVADDEIARMQSALDKLIADGTQARLFRKYGLEIESH